MPSHKNHINKNLTIQKCKSNCIYSVTNRSLRREYNDNILCTARKLLVFGVFLVRIFPHWD